MGCRHSSVDSSAPSILLLRVQLPSMPSMLFSIIVKFVIYLSMQCEKRTNLNKKEAGLGPFFKKRLASLMPISAIHNYQIRNTESKECESLKNKCKTLVIYNSRCRFFKTNKLSFSRQSWTKSENWTFTQFVFFKTRLVLQKVQLCLGWPEV